MEELAIGWKDVPLASKISKVIKDNSSITGKDLASRVVCVWAY